jgi:hypothetical protein
MQCQTIQEAERMKDDLEKARGIIPRLLASFIPPSDPRTFLWEDFFKKAFIKAEFETTKIVLRMETRDVEIFVRKLISPPPVSEGPSVPAPFLGKNN